LVEEAMPRGKSRTRPGKVARRRRNPIARALRDAAYRARKEANRRQYSRKAKHKPVPDAEPD